MFKKLLCIFTLLSFTICLASNNSEITFSQPTISVSKPTKVKVKKVSKLSLLSKLETPVENLEENMIMGDVNNIDVLFIQPKNQEMVCSYWDCREYPCKCMSEQLKCKENYFFDHVDKKCKPTDACLSQWKGCGVGQMFSYESCECQCQVKCADGKICLPGVCLCGEKTMSVNK